MASENRTLWLDYLRSFITVLVVAHHASLAYTTFAFFDKEAYIRSTHAIVDTKRWVGLDIFENFNDVFFMALMFFISGLFVVKSIQKKGAANFVKDRIYRLFIPFLVLGTLLNMIAYYPSYLVAHGGNDIAGYLPDFFKVEQWPVGPPWFIWVLFLFNVLFAIFYSMFGKSVFGQKFQMAFLNKPGNLIAFWFLFTFLLYVPFAFWVGPGTWTGFGPFDFQLSRMVLYFGYFMLGAAIGNTDFNETLFAAESGLVRNWWLWVVCCLSTYAVLTIIPEKLTALVKAQQLTELNGYLIYFSVYVASATFSCMAFLTTFRALVHTPSQWWKSLSDNAYLIYLTHFAFLTWCQFALLDADLPAFVKFLITFVAAVAGSWMISMVIRKNAFLRRYL
jgi:glucan biosynthesis protein C